MPASVLLEISLSTMVVLTDPEVPEASRRTPRELSTATMRSRLTIAPPVPVGTTMMPPPSVVALPFSDTRVSMTLSRTTPEVFWTTIPLPFGAKARLP
ncbi:hypothetical protein D3C86_1958310 [compost metagenome]